MNKINLNGIWKLWQAPLSFKGKKGLTRIKKNSADWIPARVPGEVHLDLIRTGQMEEPLVSTNAPKCRWPEEKSWWYHREFELTAITLDCERQFLVFDGVDHYGQVFLNGCFIGETRNSFISHRFEVSDFLKPGENSLMVRVTAGNELAEDDGAISRPINVDENAPHPIKDNDLYRHRNWLGRIWLRKPQFSYGWDWVDSLPNIGLWRDIRLEAYNYAKFEEVHCRQKFMEDKVILTVNACVENLHSWKERQAQILLNITCPNQQLIVCEKELSLMPGLNYFEIPVEIVHPELWWPNGMGQQPLYKLNITLAGNGHTLDQQDYDLGLREIELDRSRLSEGARFCLKINGQEVFCRGANWVPADAIPARISPEKYETLVTAAADANFNMLRVWGGGIYEDPSFYQACDRAGIMVWQDFMFACAIYPDFHPEFRKAIWKEAESTVKTLRHHPSIVMWCGNNENHWGFREWWNTPESKKTNCGGEIVYNRILPEICQRHDPDCPYWPGSPAGGTAPNCETSGDCHWWQPFTMNKNLKKRVVDRVFDTCKSRFVSEYGVIGPCSLSSVKKYLKPEEMKLDHSTWLRHTNPHAKNTIQFGLKYHYGVEPDRLELDDYLCYGQLLQGMLLQRSLEALRFRKHDPENDCQGALTWMFNDCWGETGWSIIDSYLNRKAAYYAVKRAFQPLKVIVRRKKDQIILRIVNDTLEKQFISLESGWMKLDGSEKKMQSRPCELLPNSMRQVAQERIPFKTKSDLREWIFIAILRNENDILDTTYFTFCQLKFLRLPTPKIEISRKNTYLELTSAGFCHGVHHNHENQEILSDNWFDLLPGIPVRINLIDDTSAKKITFRAIDFQLKRQSEL